MRIVKLRNTLALYIPNKKDMPFVQFSLKEPWLIPRHEDNCIRSIYGWLFFYFGYLHMPSKEVL